MSSFPTVLEKVTSKENTQIDSQDKLSKPTLGKNMPGGLTEETTRSNDYFCNDFNPSMLLPTDIQRTWIEQTQASSTA